MRHLWFLTMLCVAIPSLGYGQAPSNRTPTGFTIRLDAPDEPEPLEATKTVTGKVQKTQAVPPITTGPQSSASTA